MTNSQENPKSGIKLLIASLSVLTVVLTLLFFNLAFSGSALSAPSDSISTNNIEVYPDKIVIQVKGASLSEYAPTGSMKPLFDTGANGIRVVPSSEDEIQIGDIITFEREGLSIVHRVIEKGEDAEGTYFMTKGDNNLVSDGKVRFEDIKFKTIGILY